MQVYLDESGDLGWNFDMPYRQGGSSRFLTLAFLFLPFNYRRAPKNLIRQLYGKYGWRHEKKASSATLSQKLLFCQKAVEMLKRHPNIKVDVIVANKENVQTHIRSDANKLYNYMSSLVIPDYVGKETEIEFIPDKRSIKVSSGNSLVDYLQVKLWFELGFETAIKYNPSESHSSYNLQFIDWIAHCIWLKFENAEPGPFNMLKPFTNIRHLFFERQ